MNNIVLMKNNKNKKKCKINRVYRKNNSNKYS